ncbi:antitoxin Xre/MbcA/ParS toxin-binding domain-containing protein [Sphingosinicella rhizophila]|jgi:uncharacterized protein (DUF2384 family)|uniref:Antitoxin Xre/MbcA/ParS toxin-binding domain-containing protein n=1 Tax=Sphingosinicella rhizophila TaxID=3050082 RepID=A0ABU3Q5E5_9SPHN|nr:antitoxin Xre/MbcA/ParS toxin-binding domain-containing protein [Sphingosinicella sp. GR2756]MDT9598635.1 antitoxin Xre/MbcA/ParS toxin-binding domain-containing protein [Sphingosinicella sp. GR2756]
MVAPSVAHEGGGRTAIPVGLDVFMPLAEAWNLSTDEQMRLLGSPPRSTFFKWKKDGGALPRDTVDRISNLLAIWKSLEILFTDPARSVEWIKRPNEFFGGMSALDTMLEEGNFFDMARVRQYLDAQRGG